MSKKSPMCPTNFIEAGCINHNEQFLYSIDSLNEFPVFQLGIPAPIFQKPDG